jgi:KDO2-lipid IV(A) lauroyltransferase
MFELGSERRHYALVNLQIAYPDLSAARLRQLGLSSYEHLSWNLVDLARSERWTQEGHLRHVEFKDTHHFEAAAARGRGVLLLMPHLGCFELAKRAAPVAGFALSAITRVFPNPLLYADFARAGRDAGVELIDHRGSQRPVVRALRAGRIVAVLNDQHARRSSKGIWAPLFGVRCRTSAGVARLALHTGAAVVPGYVIRDGPEHHTFYFEPEVSPPANRDLEDFVVAQNAVLERMIRAHPEQWLWTTRRFRRSPDLPGDVYRRRGR